MSEEKKPIILEIDNVRIRKWDEQNYFIEREETKEIYNPQTERKEVKTSYQFKGYYSTISACLKSIHTKGLLIDEKAISDLNSHLNEVNKSEERILRAFNRLDVNHND